VDHKVINALKCDIKMLRAEPAERNFFQQSVATSWDGCTIANAP